MKDLKKKKQNDNENESIFKDKIIVVLLAIVILLLLAIIGIKIATKNFLDTEGELVTELHNYFNYDDLGNCDGLFNYDEKKVGYDDISSEIKLCLAYQKATIKNVETGTLTKDKKKNTCTKDGMTFRLDDEQEECSYTKVPKNIIDDSYKKLYGKDIEDNESFKVDNLNICYLKDDYYYCGLSETFTYTLGNESVIYRVIQKAIEEGSDIVIYDYFAKINNDTCFKTYTTATINENCTEEYKNQKELNYKFMEKYGTKYKHVFRLADDDTYYWVSSEPVVD